MIVLYPRPSWDSHDCCLPPPKTVLPYQSSKELNQGLANSATVSTFMTSDIKLTVFKLDSGELHDFGTPRLLKPDQIHWQTPGRVWHILKTDGIEWIERLRQTLSGHWWFGNVSGVQGSSSIPRTGRAEASLHRLFLFECRERTEAELGGHDWHLQKSMRMRRAAQHERMSAASALLCCSTDEVSGTARRRFWLDSDVKVVVWGIFCSYARLGHSVTIPNTLTSAVSLVSPPTSLNTFNYSAGD